MDIVELGYWGQMITHIHPSPKVADIPMHS